MLFLRCSEAVGNLGIQGLEDHWEDQEYILDLDLDRMGLHYVENGAALRREYVYVMYTLQRIVGCITKVSCPCV